MTVRVHSTEIVFSSWSSRVLSLLGSLWLIPALLLAHSGSEIVVHDAGDWLVWLAVVTVSIRTVRQRCVLRSDEIVCCNVFTTRRVARADVAMISVDDPAFLALLAKGYRTKNCIRITTESHHLHPSALVRLRNKSDHDRLAAELDLPLLHRDD